jgi:hypothetical protein
MTDSWEILGRLAADATFWGDVKKAALSAPPRPGANGRSAIPEGDYKKALDTVRNAGTGLKDQPISLMALGELLVALASNNFRAALDGLATAIQHTGMNTVGRDFNFYVALGAMIVDGQLRGQLLSAPPYKPFDTFGFVRVLPADRADLVKLGDANQSPAVAAAANTLCGTVWHPDCNLKVVIWTGHTHPVANP